MAINPSEITTVRVGELPDGVISMDSKIAIENGTDLYKTDVQGFVDFLNIHIGARQYQFIELYVDQTYIDTNFDSTGLGIGICEGIAICNGQNGTPVDDGLVHIGYGTNYNVVNAVGGSKDAVVVAHTHNVRVNTNAAGTGFPAFEAASAQGTFATESTGVSGVDKNMQPYRVVLRCMKL